MGILTAADSFVHAGRMEEVAFVDPNDVCEEYRDEPANVLLEDPSPGLASRWAFFNARPFLVFRCKDGVCEAGPPSTPQKLPGRPLQELRRLLALFRLPKSQQPPGAPPFVGGAVGYLGYELLHDLEDVPATARDDLQLPDALLLFCGVTIASDLIGRRTWLASHAFGAGASARAETLWREAEGKLAAARWRTSHHSGYREAGAASIKNRQSLRAGDLERFGFQAGLDARSYMAAVERVRKHIRDGDVFEVCLTNRFSLADSFDGRLLYGVLREVSPAPMAAWLRTPDAEVFCSSPERFLRMTPEGFVESRPIKGTRPRGVTAEADEALRSDLARHPKDRAENLMIVDLVRSDLGRVCEFGTVRVPALAEVEPHAFTHQLVSTVQGRLRAGLGAVDLVCATFPGGSMTGAPKVQALKIIDALEPVRRGIYSGALGYFGFDGGLDLNIVIRTLIQTRFGVSFHVGGAIVADSVPAAEYQETLDKAHGLLIAVEVADAQRRRR